MELHLSILDEVTPLKVSRDLVIRRSSEDVKYTNPHVSSAIDEIGALFTMISFTAPKLLSKYQQESQADTCKHT